jgi:hypothetical protein
MPVPLKLSLFYTLYLFLSPTPPRCLALLRFPASARMTTVTLISDDLKTAIYFRLLQPLLVPSTEESVTVLASRRKRSPLHLAPAPQGGPKRDLSPTLG